MNWLNFKIYDKNEEELGGDYWKFLDADFKTIEEDNIFLDDISNIINNISNEDLKIKMKQKVFDLIMENGVFYNGAYLCLDIFSSDEIKLILEHELTIKINKLTSNQNDIRYYTNDLSNLIYLFKMANDSKWEYLMITNILNIVKNNSNKSALVNLIELYKDRDDIYIKLINDYDNYLPDAYKNYLKMKGDHNYIYNKSLQFFNEDLDIGIDPRIAIAPEIEANNDYDIRINISDQIGFEEYEMHSEATVPNGSEIAPKYPFHNTKEDMAKFCALCESMSEMGYYYDELSGNASGQINLGLDYLDTKEAILNFYEIYGNCEELLYYISNEAGQLFRQDVYVNSRIKAISEIIGKRILDEELTRDDVIKLFNSHKGNNDEAFQGLQYKKNSVCLRGRGDKDYRLEFRIPNGGCNYITWIDNIRLFGKMMEIAKRLADMMKKDYLSSEDERLLKLKIDLQDDNLSLEDKLVILMNLLFKEDNIKKIYYNRYISTVKKINETNSKKYQYISNKYDPDFDEVEFIGKYNSRFDSDHKGNGIVVEYDPDYGIIEHNRKKH